VLLEVESWHQRAADVSSLPSGVPPVARPVRLAIVRNQRGPLGPVRSARHVPVHPAATAAAPQFSSLRSTDTASWPASYAPWAHGHLG
jgi:hypothetical protein